MKRIICFTESLAGGGAEHQMVILAQLLSENGYDVTIVTYADIADHYDLPNQVNRVRIHNTKCQIIKLLAIFFYFIRIKTDCVISYRQACNARVLLPLLFRKNIKVICSERNTTFGEPTFYEKILFSFLYKRADYIVPNSYSQERYIENRVSSYKNKLRTIINYTDMYKNKFTLVPNNLNSIKIAIFSRFSLQKNCSGLAKAVKQLKETTSFSFQIHWYGNNTGSINGYNSDYLKFSELISSLEISDVLLTKPAVKDPSKLMGEYHAVCLPSLFEGFSNSIAEAICCGKPMLVSDVSDNSLMVHNGENGFLFDPKDIDSICYAFLSFFDLNYEEMRKMGKRSREIAESLFDKESFIKKYIDLIES